MKYQQSLRHIHRIDRVLWISVFSGMLVISVVALIFNYTGLLTGQLIQLDPQLDNALLVLTIGLLFLIFYLKRQFLVPEKIAKRAQRKNIVNITHDISSLKNEFGEKAELVKTALMLIRRYFMLVWSVANVILLLGFIVFMLAGQFQTFLIYAVVAFYSMIINFPVLNKMLAVIELIDKQPNLSDHVS